MSRRIVHVLDSLATGGAERIAVDLAIEQVKSGHDLHIYCISSEGELAQQAREAGVKVTNFAKPPGLSLRTILAVARKLRGDRPEVVHTHNPAAHYYGALAAFFASIPTILNTRHSPVSSWPRYNERYFEWLLPLTSEVVFVSQHARDMVEKQWRWCRKEAIVITNGVPTRKFRARHANPGANRPSFVFGTIGRLAPVKNHKLLIAAFRQVLESCRGARLRIVGDGPLRETLNRVVSEMHLSEVVSVEPSTLDTPGVLTAFDTFVISSDSEGLPLVLLEAMAAGLPIVSTRVGGIPEVISEEHVGWLCPPSDQDALAAAMLTAYKARDLAERGRAACELASAKFDLSQMAEKYEQLMGGRFSALEPHFPQ
jgi:glycosyltransferase involved in cell wall biosynthesis